MDICLKCSICQKIFASKKSLKNHEKLIHLSKETYYCNLCQKRFATKSTKIRHIKTVHGDKEDVHQEYIYLCTICETKFTSNSSRRRHERIIHNFNEQRPFACSHCSVYLKSEVNRKKHEDEAHNNIPRDSKFPDAKWAVCLRSEVIDSTKFKCNFCPELFSYLRKKLKHIRIKHPSTFLFDCKYCDKRFQTKYLKKRHEKGVHHVSYDIERKTCVTCTDCKLDFTSIKSLREHRARFHEEDMNFTILHFENMIEFQQWKEVEEKEKKAEFRITRRSNPLKMVFNCRRSGAPRKYKPVNDPTKRRKNKKGHIQMGMHCTSTMEVIIHPDSEEVTVNYYATHYGHIIVDSLELGNLDFPKDEEFPIIRECVQGLSDHRILKDIQKYSSKLKTDKKIRSKKRKENEIQEENEFLSVESEIKKLEKGIKAADIAISDGSNKLQCHLATIPLDQEKLLSDNALIQMGIQRKKKLTDDLSILMEKKAKLTK